MASSKAGKAATWMTACALCVGGFEGLWLTAKPDTLAYNIPTVCYGETEGVKVGDTYTKSECIQMLADKLPRYWKEIETCIKVPVSDNEKIAYTSFAYNVGSAGFCRSTTLKRLNAGDREGACNALMSWTRAGGKYVKGLENRRAKERTLCLTPDKFTIASPDVPEVTTVIPKAPDAPKVTAPLVCTGWWFWKVCK